MSIVYAFVFLIIFNTTREMIRHIYMSRETFTHFSYVARDNYAFFLRVGKSGSGCFVQKKIAHEAAIRKVLGFYASATECDIRENFDTNEYPIIFVSQNLHEWMSKYIHI